MYNLEPSGAQMTTRSKLLNKMRKTIETALTKYEQVEIVADSCLQSTSLNGAGNKFRTMCNSCNLPLGRKRMVSDRPSEMVGPSPELRAALNAQAGREGASGQQQRPRTTAGRMISAPESGIHTDRSTRSNHSTLSNTSTSRTEPGYGGPKSSVVILKGKSSESKGKYINRGGFRMPKSIKLAASKSTPENGFDWSVGGSAPEAFGSGVASVRDWPQAQTKLPQLPKSS